jgi:DinB family protein
LTTLPEVWLRGPVEGITPVLQPVAHALLQAREEVEAMMEGFPEEQLWSRPAGVASPGFHLQHLSGVLSRLFTYARGEALSPEQREALKLEDAASRPDVTSAGLVSAFRKQVDASIEALRAADEHLLTAAREVGRGKLPSTVLGLIVHAAEHTQRHVGQLLVTVRILRGGLS